MNIPAAKSAAELKTSKTIIGAKLRTYSEVLGWKIASGLKKITNGAEATKPHNDECRERIRTIIERTLTRKASMNVYKDRIAETERIKERTRARVERCAGDVLMEPGNRDDEQMAVRHADAYGGDIRENQHEEDRTRDIQVGKRGLEAQVKNNMTS